MTIAERRTGPHLPARTAAVPSRGRRGLARGVRVVPGLLSCAALATAATAIGTRAPVIGAPVVAIVLGIVVSIVGRRVGSADATLAPGVAVARGFVLQLAVVVLGAQLSLAEIVHVGVGSLPVMLGTLAACLTVAQIAGRRLGVDTDLRTLIGVGTGICGASAIAAVSPVIRAHSRQIAYAVSTIFLFNVVAVLVFPPLGHALGMSQSDFGLLAGTSVNDTSSVVAAASAYGHGAADHAVVVKLVRTLAIVPICLGLAALGRRRDLRAGRTVRTSPANPLRYVPWFLIGFLLVAAANTAGLIPVSSHAGLGWASTFLVTTALAGIGLSTDLTELRRTGVRPLALGFILWITVTSASLLLQWATG